MGAGRYRVTNPNQTPNACLVDPGSETAGDKLRRQKEKSPDHQLRSLTTISVGKEVGVPQQPGGWLRSSHPLKSA